MHIIFIMWFWCDYAAVFLWEHMAFECGCIIVSLWLWTLLWWWLFHPFAFSLPFFWSFFRGEKFALCFACLLMWLFMCVHLLGGVKARDFLMSATVSSLMIKFLLYPIHLGSAFWILFHVRCPNLLCMYDSLCKKLMIYGWDKIWLLCEVWKWVSFEQTLV